MENKYEQEFLLVKLSMDTRDFECLTNDVETLIDHLIDMPLQRTEYYWEWEMDLIAAVNEVNTYSDEFGKEIDVLIKYYGVDSGIAYHCIDDVSNLIKAIEYSDYE